MRTEVRLHRTAGRVRVHTRTGLLSPRVVATTATSARVVLVATHATLLTGDRVVLDLAVEDGLALEIEDVAATVAYDGRGGAPACWSTRLSVGTDATLVWAAEPFVVATGAEVHRRLAVDVADRGRALLRDTIVLGRSGERGGRLECRTRVGYAGVPLLAEDLSLDGSATDDPAVRGDHRVIDQVLAAGWRPDSPVQGADVYDLAAPGRLARHLGADAHSSPLPQVLATWKRSALRVPRNTVATSYRNVEAVGDVWSDSSF